MMQKMVPLDKMSKKQRSAVHRAKRGSWNGVVPVTRVKESGINDAGKRRSRSE